MQKKLNEANRDREVLFNEVMTVKTKMANEIDETIKLNNELLNMKAVVEIEKKRFEAEQIEFEKTKESFLSGD